MFDTLKQYRAIIVTGCQRSGTTLTARAIAYDTGHMFISEDDYGVHSIPRWSEYVRTGQDVVIHSPAMMHIAHQFGVMDGVLIVCVQRDYDAIRRSMKRMKWDVNESGLERVRYTDYAPNAFDVVSTKYAYWRDVQAPVIKHSMVVQYDDLQAHPLWLDPEPQPAYEVTPIESARYLVVTLGYRSFYECERSWHEARRYWEQCGASRYDWLTLYGNSAPEGTEGHHIIARKYQDAQRLFLAGDYEAMFIIEDDMVIPYNTFPRLQAMLLEGADIAHGLYTWRHGRGGGGWSAYPLLQETYGESLMRTPHKAAELFKQEGIIDVQGVGLGCTAIKRHVLENISFQLRGGAANDWYFAADATKAGYVTRCDLGLVCGHMTLEPTPRILWPDVADVDEPTRTMQRIEYLA